MGGILKIILAQLTATLSTLAVVTVSTKVNKLLTKMADDPIESEVGTQQLIAARCFDLYGFSGLRTLVDWRIIPDYVLVAYIIKHDIGSTYPGTGYVPDSQPNPWVNPSDFTNDEVSYKRVVTFLASRKAIDYSVTEGFLK
jgi:hypothetical protein